MNQCQATTRKGTRCQRRSIQNGYCRQHHSGPVSGDPVITITFGDVTESRAGMVKQGDLADEGFSREQLEEIASSFPRSKLAASELHYLDEGIENADPATLLILRNGISELVGEEAFQAINEELWNLPWDKQAKSRYGKVVQLRARYNLCFDEENVEPDYEAGVGRVIAWKDAPELKSLREKITQEFGSVCEAARGLSAEGNYYYDSNICGIGYHGDKERRIVLGCRFGASMPLVFYWYQRSERISDEIRFHLHSGDIYLMDAKAVGFDSLKKKIPTLRHAAGAEKYLR